MKRSSLYLAGIVLIFTYSCNSTQSEEKKGEPVSDKTPSKSIYFDWINSNWYGGNEHKVLSNLNFFRWMHEEYGLQLDIYLLDAGNIDNGPNCNGCIEELKSAPPYGGIDSDWFRKRYPRGLDSIVALAGSFGCKIGLWIGPDGYGNTDSSAQVRINMLDKLTKDFGIALFKMDKCCSDLNPENEKYFIEALRKCYENNPELIVLNHRISLSDSARKYTTTFLWEGAETYIDVSSCNSKPAPHHRYTLERGLPPDMKRLTEDHGVCLSSYLDYWEDDLILQAFNRNLILAPEIYGNPWLLNDQEFPLLARIFNLHRKYNSILVHGIRLPEQQYGPYAVSRGDEKTRLISLRNLSWNSQQYTLNIDESIGLSKGDRFEIRQYHPYEQILGSYAYGEQVPLELLPFRTCLLKVSPDDGELGILGCKYQIRRDTKNNSLEMELLGMPGESVEIQLTGTLAGFKKAFIDSLEVKNLLEKKRIQVHFPGKAPVKAYHRYLGALKEIPIPENSSIMLESVYFSSDNNCLEVRSLMRSGDTKIAAVEKARKAFFEDEVFLKLGAWDRFALDRNPETSFKVRNYCGISAGVMRVNLKHAQQLEKITLDGLEPGYRVKEVLFSSDLKNWRKGRLEQKENRLEAFEMTGKAVQYIKITPSPRNLAEIRAYNTGQELPVSDASVSNLFPDKPAGKVKKAWKAGFVPAGWTKNTYLCVAIEGEYGEDGAFAVIEARDTLIGPTDRSPAFPFNNWEHTLCPQNGNYTYYFKLPGNLLNNEISIIVLGTGEISKIKMPEVWMTAYPIPYEMKKLVLERK